MDPVTVAAGGAMVQLDGLVAVARHLRVGPRGDVLRLEPRQHDRLPVDAPADLKERVEALGYPVRPDEGEGPWLVDEDPGQDERRQAQRVIDVKVRQEYDLDVDRIDADFVHVRQQGRTRVEENAAIDHDRAVVTLRGEGGAGTEK